MQSEASTQTDLNHQKKIFIIAGEESGDLHGSSLVRELLKSNPKLSFIGHGGDKMKATGVEIIEHISNLSLVGLTEVIKHLPYIIPYLVFFIQIKRIKQVKKE